MKLEETDRFATLKINVKIFNEPMSAREQLQVSKHNSIRDILLEGEVY